MNSLQWLQFILSYFIQVSLVVAAAMALERWTHSATIKTRIWTVCFVSLLGLLAVGLLLPRLNWFHPWSRLGPNELLTVANAGHVLGRSLLAIWILGACIMLARWAIRSLELRRFLRFCPLVSDDVNSRLHKLAPEKLLFPSGRKAIFRISPENLGPFCYQLHQPIVCLPKSLIDGNVSELRHVLQHELTHLQTQHPMQLFAQQVVQALLWFHPLVWISGKRASLIREFVCDDAASGEGASTASYLRTLLRIVEQRSQPQSGTLSIGRSSSELRVRARRLVTSGAHSVSRRECWAVVGIFLVAVFVSQLWLPTNPLVSSTRNYSPWPTWSAATLHTFDLTVCDYEQFDSRTHLHELFEDRDETDAGEP